MNDLTSLLFYLIIGIIWFLTSILGDRVSRRREWEFPEPREDDTGSTEDRPRLERVPAKWRGQPPTPTAAPPPTTAAGAKRSVAAALSAVAEKARAAPPPMREPAPLTEEPAPMFAHPDDLERAVIVSTVVGPPVALQPRGRRRFVRLDSV